MTRFFTEGGVGEIVDFMPLGEPSCSIVRRIEVVRGSLTFRVVCEPAFDYARAPHRLRSTARSRRSSRPTDVRAALGRGTLEASGGAARRGVHARARRARVVRALRGQARADLGRGRGRGEFAETVRWWRDWIGQSRYRGRWREFVDRSAITLKLLTYEPTGAVVAAPTTSLPEHIGGPRNWDYRYCWLRDSAFTMFAFLRLGFRDEAFNYLNWLHERGNVDKEGAPLQVMYGVDGRSELTEVELPHLSGYRGSGPVRIGNGASTQLQLDVYGEVVDAVYLAERGGMPLSYRSGSSCARSSTGSPTTGISRTRASGRCAAAGATSRTRGS